jgi:oligopeptide/dipeptide ABC transporter ATP-binding protein
VADRVAVMYAGAIVEEATSDELFSNPKHPYTVGLMASIPRIDEQHASLSTIDGVVPSLLNLPTGCRFRNRCPRAITTCAESEPPLQSAGTDRKLACFNPC